VICPKCGRMQPPNARFCTKCGQILDPSQTPGGGWYVLCGGRRYGPYREDRMRGFAKEGRVNENTLVWKSGMKSWTRATDTELFQPHPTSIIGTPVEEATPGRGKTLKKVGIATAISVIVIAVLIGAYYAGFIGTYMRRSDQAGQSVSVEESQAMLSIGPETVEAGENLTLSLSVTNQEPDTMTISQITQRTYRENQLFGEVTVPLPEGWVSTVPPGQTVTIGSLSFPVGPGSEGTWRAELVLHTSAGTFSASDSFTILPATTPTLVYGLEAIGDEIRLNVYSGNIPSGEWEYFVSPMENFDLWWEGEKDIEPPFITLENGLPDDTYYVSLKHKTSDFIYFKDVPVVVGGASVAEEEASVQEEVSLLVSPGSFTLDSGASTTITATLTSDGSPLSGKTISWAATDGSLSSSSATTDSSGRATVTYTAPSVAVQSDVTITVSFSGDAEYQAVEAKSSGTIEVTNPALDVWIASITGSWEHGTSGLPEYAFEATYMVRNTGDATADTVRIAIAWGSNSSVEYAHDLAPGESCEGTFSGRLEMEWETIDGVQRPSEASAEIQVTASAGSENSTATYTISKKLPWRTTTRNLWVTPDDPVVRSLLENILQGKAWWDIRADWKVVRDWVKNNIVYAYDDEYESSPNPGTVVGDGRPGPEYWQLPRETIQLGQGDCEDQAILMVSLLRALGYDNDEVFAVHGDPAGGGVGHVWVVLRVWELWGYEYWRLIEPTSGGLFTGAMDFFHQLEGQYESRYPENRVMFNDDVVIKLS